jgi:hypothetical protein
MAVPRPILLLAVIGAVLMAATFYAVRGAKEAPTPAPSLPKASSAPTSVTPRGHPPPGVHPRHATNAPAKPTLHPRPADQPTTRAKLVPAEVARALARKQVVVLFFFERGAADDAATARSVAAVRRHGKRVRVFAASVRRLSQYRQVIGGLGISTVPSTVIVGRDRKAHVLEGFVDERSLIQEVADSAK